MFLVQTLAPLPLKWGESYLLVFYSQLLKRVPVVCEKSLCWTKDERFFAIYRECNILHHLEISRYSNIQKIL